MGTPAPQSPNRPGVSLSPTLRVATRQRIVRIAVVLALSTLAVLWLRDRMTGPSPAVRALQVAARTAPCGTWTFYSNLSPNENESRLTALGVSPAGDVWTFGYTHTYLWQLSLTHPIHQDYEPYGAHWDGGQWTFSPLPRRDGSNVIIHDVAVVTADNIWVVGTTTDPRTDYDSTYIAHWNGQRWAILPSPSPGTAWNRLSGVAVAAPDDMWAVGAHTSSRSLELTHFWCKNLHHITGYRPPASSPTW